MSKDVHISVSPDSKEPNGIIEENAIYDSEKRKLVKSPGFEDILDSVVMLEDW